MILLHRKWAAIGAVASKDQNRPFLTGVHVRHMEGGKIELAATDGARLLRVCVNTPADPQEFPVLEGMPRDDTRASAIIPAGVFQKVLASNKVKNVPLLAHVAVTLTGQDGKRGGAALGFTDLLQPTVTQTPTIEGPYPNYAQVIPKGAASYTITVNADYLADTLQAISRMLDGGRGTPPLVTLRFYRKQTQGGTSLDPFRMDAEDEDGNRITAVIAPVRPDHIPEVEGA